MTASQSAPNPQPVGGNQSDVMTDVRGPCVPLGVVAARTKYGIVRGMTRAFDSRWRDDLRQEVEKYVGRLDPDVAWTFHRYDVPSYVAYGHLEGVQFDVPLCGVWLFRWVDEGRTRTTLDGERLSVVARVHPGRVQMWDQEGTPPGETVWVSPVAHETEGQS